MISRQRLDQWLYHARFFKSRSLAGKECQKKRLLVDGERLSKPSQLINPGQIIEFLKEKETLTIKILALGKRRGPAPEAQALYEDLTPKPETPDPLQAAKSNSPFRRERGAGRPTKAERRALDKFKNFE